MIAVERLCLIEPFYASVEPTLCHGKAVLGILVVAEARRTFIESHHDIGADDALRVHDALR